MDFDCGISRARLEAWLTDELESPFAEECWTFSAHGGSCRVRLTPLGRRTLGSFSLQRTRLQAEGDACALEELERLFTLRFLSAGG